MKKTIIVIAAILVVGLIAGAYLMNPSTQRIIDKYILSKEEPPPSRPVEPEKWIYVLADGTGSTYGTYAIPKVTSKWLGDILNEMYKTSGGRLYLSHIDRDSRNNQVLYVSVPKEFIPSPKPIRKAGEISFEYTKRLNIWKGSLIHMKSDSTDIANEYSKAKAKFLNDCSTLLEKKVYIKSPDNQWTDIIGILNASFITMKNEQGADAVKYVVGFSDFIQDAPHLKKIKLDSIPYNLQLLAVNPVQNSSKKITNDVVELEHPQRVIEIIFSQ